MEACDTIHKVRDQELDDLRHDIEELVDLWEGATASGRIRFSVRAGLLVGSKNRLLVGALVLAAFAVILLLLLIPLPREITIALSLTIGIILGALFILLISG